MDETALRETLHKLEDATRIPDAGTTHSTVTDEHGFVTISYGSQAEVRVDRALCPEPDRRDQLERAIAAAVDALVTEREANQRALGEELGRVVREGAQADLAEPMAAFEERIAGVKEQLQSRLARIERRRTRN